jgi:hypothetical protein
VSKYAIEDDAPLTVDRTKLRLERLDLHKLEVGQSFFIPNIERTLKGKKIMSPETGVNIKAANELYKPKKFTKIKTVDKNGNAGVRVGRVE